MADNEVPINLQLAGAIRQLQADVASLKVRFAVPANLELEKALSALAAEPVSRADNLGLSEEIQKFKSDISLLKDRIASAAATLPSGRPAK